MKGTLYSSDFVKNLQNEFKLLELNTDTDFASASLQHFDWNPFIEQLNSSSIDTVHVIYKGFQEHLANNFSESLDNSEYDFTWEETIERPETIYPTDVQDSSTKMVLRMAYNEAAILDSDYCKNGVQLYKLFQENNNQLDVIEHYVSSSNDEYVNDTLNKATNEQNIPDYVVKDVISSDGVHLEFYKLGSSSLDAEIRFDEMISSSYEDGDIITSFHDTTGDGDTVSSYRTCNIIYGNDLDLITVGTYKVDAWLDIPETLTVDDTELINKLPNKHRYEFASNWPKEFWKNQGGVSSQSELQNVSGSLVQAQHTVIGDYYKSINIAGLPDVDVASTIESWSYAGNALPTGTELTSSALVSKASSSVAYGVLNEISMSNDSSIFVGSALPILVYDKDDDLVRFEYVRNLDTGSYQLFNSSGSLIDIVENNLVVFENNELTYELNMETDDTFLINNAGIYLIAHNPYYNGGAGFFTCFLAGTQISTVVGPKNIEDILVGDTVITWDEKANKFSESEVTNIDHRHTVGDHIAGCQEVGYNQAGVFKLTCDMGKEDDGISDLGIRFTPEHPFLTKDGWKALAPLPNQEPWATEGAEIQHLEVGDFLKWNDGPEGSWIEIKEIEFEVYDANTSVYNIEVKDTRNYIAGNVVVHNKA
jgi:hypothetical protein